jgi:hypothetical protein
MSELVKVGTPASHPLAMVLDKDIPFYGKLGKVGDFEAKLRAAAEKAALVLAEEGVNELVAEHVQTNISASSEGEGGFLSEVESRAARPALLIRQGTTNLPTMPQDTPLGKLFSTAGVIIPSPVRVRLLYAYDMHLRYPPMGEGSRAPVCKSPDGKLGSPGGWCQTCPQLPFGKQRGGQGEQVQTECSQLVNFVMITEDMKYVFDVPMSRTSLKTAKVVTTLAKATGRVESLVKRVFILDTESKTNQANQRYFQYKVAVDDKGPVLSDADLRALVALSELLQAQNQALLAKFYASVRDGQTVAHKAEEAFDPRLAMGNLDGGGVEPSFGSGGSAPDSRGGSSPM